MAKETKIGNVTFRELTNEEAVAKYGSSFVFVGSKPASLEQAATAAGHRAKSASTGTKKFVKRIVKDAITETLATAPKSAWKSWHQLWEEAAKD